MFSTIGFLFLMLGIAGYLIPGLPGTPLLLVAAWLFSMSSERLYRWMTTNRWFGRTISDYMAGLGISRRVKTIAIVSMAVFVPISVMMGTDDWRLRLLITALGATGAIFVLTRPTRDLSVDEA
jgi:hypothetical protein